MKVEGVYVVGSALGGGIKDWKKADIANNNDDGKEVYYSLHNVDKA